MKEYNNSALYVMYGIEGERFLSLRQFFEYLQECSHNKHGEYLKVSTAAELLAYRSPAFVNFIKGWINQSESWYKLLNIFKRSYTLLPNEKVVIEDILIGYTTNVNPASLPDPIPLDDKGMSRESIQRRDSIVVGYTILRFIAARGINNAVGERALLLGDSLREIEEEEPIGTKVTNKLKETYVDIKKLASEMASGF